jgi:hypothetical protein
MPPLPTTVLDRILALQLGVAWAGEGLREMQRLGWWTTDVVDELGGGALFAELMPRTQRWASLQAALEAASRVDRAARLRMADPDSVRTLFHFGFEVDEQLAERLAAHKRGDKSPHEALGHLLAFTEDFTKDAVKSWLESAGPSEFKVEAGGRALKGTAPASAELAAVRLAAALVPFADKYPMPYFRAGAS